MEKEWKEKEVSRDFTNLRHPFAKPPDEYSASLLLRYNKCKEHNEIKNI